MLDLTKLPSKAPEYDLTALFEAGCHFGHQKNKWHPKMRSFIYMEKDGIHIFDLAKTASQLQLAYNALYQLGLEGKTVVMVGTKRSVRDIVTQSAQDSGMLYITARWLGGLFTNWDQVKLSLKKLITTEDKLKSGGFKGYTKYEILQIEEDVIRLDRFFGGIRGLEKLPDCIVVIDPNHETIAVKEAHHVGVPVIALIDSNGNPDLVDIAIPANDDAPASVALIVAELTKAYQQGRADGGIKMKTVPQASGAPTTPVIPASTVIKTAVEKTPSDVVIKDGKVAVVATETKVAKTVKTKSAPVKSIKAKPTDTKPKSTKTKKD